MKIKSLLPALLGVLMAFGAVAATASTMPYTLSFNKDVKILYKPLTSISWEYAGRKVAMTQDVKISLYDEDNELYKGDLFIQNNQDNTGAVATAGVDFHISGLLPKGHVYHFTVPAGVIWDIDTPAIKNEKMDVTFTVPAHIGLVNCEVMGYVYEKYLPDQFPLQMANGFVFNYSIPAITGSNRNIKILRDGSLLREYPIEKTKIENKGWDTNAECFFHYSLFFDRDVNYTLILPEGTLVCDSLKGYRSDITNEEVKIAFTGDYVYDPYPGDEYPYPQKFGITGINSTGDAKYFGETWIKYDGDLRTMDKAHVELIRDGEVWEDIKPQMQYRDSVSYLYCDFRNHAITDDSPAEYSIHIPEGTVVTRESYPYINMEETIPLDRAGVAGIADNGKCRVWAEGSDIVIDGAAEMAWIYTPDGRLVAQAAPSGQILKIGAPGCGLYIVKIAGQAFKVTTR